MFLNIKRNTGILTKDCWQQRVRRVIRPENHTPEKSQYKKRIQKHLKIPTLLMNRGFKSVRKEWGKEVERERERDVLLFLSKVSAKLVYLSWVQHPYDHGCW